MGGLGALQSNCQYQDEGLSGTVSDHHALLCLVCFFGEEPGNSAESPLNQVGNWKSNEKQLDVFPQGWVAFWDRCLHPKGLVRGFQLWFQILVNFANLQVPLLDGLAPLCWVHLTDRSPNQRFQEKIGRWIWLTYTCGVSLNERNTRQWHCPSLLFSSPSQTKQGNWRNSRRPRFLL